MSDWILIKDTPPPKNEKLWFWLVGKTPEECLHDSSGKPICPNYKPFKLICKWKCWPSTMKATHWMALPDDLNAGFYRL